MAADEDEEGSRVSVSNPAEEGRKLYYDLFKHLTTLSSGSILLLVTFKEKLFPAGDAEWKPLMGWVFFLFMLCIVSSVITMGFYAAAITRPRQASSIGFVSVVGILISAASFVGAFVGLITFAFKNIY